MEKAKPDNFRFRQSLFIEFYHCFVFLVFSHVQDHINWYAIVFQSK